MNTSKSASRLATCQPTLCITSRPKSREFCRALTGCGSGLAAHALSALRHGVLYLLSQEDIVQGFQSLFDPRDRPGARTRRRRIGPSVKLKRRVIICKATVITRRIWRGRRCGANWVQEGLITVISAVEPCRTVGVCPGATKETKRAELKLNWGKCIPPLFLLFAPATGVSSAAADLVFPSWMQVCFNGREWLAHQMKAKRASSIVRRDNCFEWIKDTGGGAAADGQLEPGPVATAFWSR